MQITAAVCRAQHMPFVIDTVELSDPRPDEVVVRIVASGMCQTDLHARDGHHGTPFPAVYGHEGAGIVAEVGKAVTQVKPGDHVVISFPWCGTCPNCQRDMIAHCQKGYGWKFGGKRIDGSYLIHKDGQPIHSAFFQQSSFGTYAIAGERFVVKVRNDAPLEQLGPFACSGQTGAGAVFNTVKPRPGDSFALFGAGAVGLSSLMAAKITGCDPIIAVDVHDHRLKLARELGATHTINHQGRDSVVEEIRDLTGGGARVSIETTASPTVFREAVDCLVIAGTCILLGSAPPGTEVKLEMPFLQFGRMVRGIIQGESVPREFIPRLVDYVVDGRMPVHKMMTFYKLADINQAAADSEAGKTIKPVLRMPA